MFLVSHLHYHPSDPVVGASLDNSCFEAFKNRKIRVNIEAAQMDGVNLGFHPMGLLGYSTARWLCCVSLSSLAILRLRHRYDMRLKER